MCVFVFMFFTCNQTNDYLLLCNAHAHIQNIKHIPPQKLLKSNQSSRLHLIINRTLIAKLCIFTSVLLLFKLFFLSHECFYCSAKTTRSLWWTSTIFPVFQTFSPVSRDAYKQMTMISILFEEIHVQKQLKAKKLTS